MLMPVSDAAISCEGLTKSFGEVAALRGIDLQVPAGTILGLLGPNGAGKTTAVRILTTILTPDAGSAKVLGKDVEDDAQDVREIIGLAGQYAAVDELLTGRENLTLVGRLTHQPKAAIPPRVQELLERFDIAEAGDRPARTYSGGMRRRLDLAAALVHKPPVLFMDEPTTGLDPRGRRELWAILRELVADGTTLLLTTQYLDEAEELADNIVVIDEGRVIAEGTSDVLKQQLGATIVEIAFAEAATGTAAAAQLASVGPVEVVDGGTTIEVSVGDTGKAVLAVARVLDAGDFVPETLEVREPSLDDVFLHLTGHRAEADATAGEGE